MKTYKVISKLSSPEFYDSLDYGTTNVIGWLYDLSENTSAIILADGIYDKLTTHAAFKQTFTFQAFLCPVAKAFLFAGKWYCDESSVNPLLVYAGDVNKK